MTSRLLTYETYNSSFLLIKLLSKNKFQKVQNKFKIIKIFIKMHKF